MRAIGQFPQIPGIPNPQRSAMDRFAGVEPLDTWLGVGNCPSLRAREYPCVRRLRHRRLITFLWLQGHDEAAQLMVRDTCTVFSAKELRVLVEQGQWRDAVDYLSRFLPEEADTWGVVASVLHRFLAVHMDLADIVAGVKFGQDRLAVLHREYLCQNLNVTFCRGTSRLRSMILNIIRKRQQARASLDWELVRCSAGEIVEDLVYRTPELRDLALLPGGPMHPHNVLPIWSRFRRSSHGKKKKQASCGRRRRASALAELYVRHRKRLPSLSQEPPEELRRKTLNLVADILEESLSAGKRQENPLQTSGKEGAPYNPIPGAPYKPLSKNMFGTSTDDATNFVTSSARGAGAIVAPVSQTMFGNLTDPAKTLGILSVANAGTSASHMLTPGAPYSVTDNPILLSAINSISSTPENSGVRLTTAKNSGVRLMTNAGAHVGVTQTKNLASHSQSFGITEHLDQEGSNAESGFHPKKNPREELAASDEQRHLKRQRTTGFFGKANQMPEAIET